jgi:hypothetical protein
MKDGRGTCRYGRATGRRSLLGDPTRVAIEPMPSLDGDATDGEASSGGGHRPVEHPLGGTPYGGS